MFAEYRRIVLEAVPEHPNGYLWLKVIKKNDGKWTIVSVRWRNWVTGIPSIVANSLGLPNPELYAGHCYRRTSAQWQADAGAMVLELQNQFCWKTSSIATVYIGQSVATIATSSRRCLPSTEMSSNEAVLNSRYQESLPSLGSRQDRNKIEVHNGQQQMRLGIIDKLLQWPVHINGQTVNIYFGGPHPIDTAPQIPTRPITPVLQDQQEEESNCRGAAAQTNQDEVDVLSDFGYSFAMFAGEVEAQLPNTAGVDEELLVPIVPNADNPAVSKKIKTNKKSVLKKQK